MSFPKTVVQRTERDMKRRAEENDRDTPAGSARESSDDIRTKGMKDRPKRMEKSEDEVG